MPTAAYTNPADRQEDYALGGNHVTHDFRTNGSFELPIGPNKLLFPNSSGWVARIIERWQTSFIVNFSTGLPFEYHRGQHVVCERRRRCRGAVRPEPGKSPLGRSRRKRPTRWELTSDLQPSGKSWIPSAPRLQWTSARFARFRRSPTPAPARLFFRILGREPEAPLADNRWHSLERGALTRISARHFEISEARSVQVRFDSTNILNHPWPGTPSLSINSANPFGYIAAKGTQRREFKGQVRLTF